MDAVQHDDRTKQELVTVEKIDGTSLEPYPDSPHTQNVAPETSRIPKNVYEGERSLLSLLEKAPRFCRGIEELLRFNADLLTMDEPSFKLLHREAITLVTQRIRVSLWQEYEAAIQHNRLMRVSQIYAGTCSENAFYKLVENKIRLAYVLCPPADYIVMLKEAHQAGLEKLREIFSARILDEEGYLNPKAADAVLKAYALLDARLKGAVVQRVDQRVLTANVSPQGVSHQQLPTDMDVLEKELAKTREQLAQLTRVPRSPTMEELQEDLRDVVIDVVDMNVNKEIGGAIKVLK